MKTLLDRVLGFCRPAKLLLAVVTALLLATPAFGQIHLSQQTCLANIGGKPIHDAKGSDLGQSSFDHVLVFHKGAYSIFIGFKDGKSVLFEIARLDGEQLSDAEISKYLDFNAEDSKFEKKAKKGDNTFWERVDGKATAVSKEKTGGQVGRLEIWDYDAFPTTAK